MIGPPDFFSEIPAKSFAESSPSFAKLYLHVYTLQVNIEIR